MLVWVALIVGGLILIVALVRHESADARASVQRDIQRGAEPDPETKSAFQYDEDEPLDWWDNQFGPHGFED